MKVYLADRSYDDCRPTCVGRQRRSLPDEANDPFDIAQRKLGNGPRVGRVMVMLLRAVNVLRPILRRRCETCLVNFGFRYRVSFVSTLKRSINIIDP